MKMQLLSLITHKRLIIRFLIAWLIGTVILFAAWFFSDAWLPYEFFMFLPGFAVSPGEYEIESVAHIIKTLLPRYPALPSSAPTLGSVLEELPIFFELP